MKLILSAITAITLTASVSFAQKNMEMTADERAKAAELHEKMAGCLRSDKSMQVCHDEAKASCADSDSKACKMMGHGEGKMKAMMQKLKVKKNEMKADAKDAKGEAEAKMNVKKEEVKQETK